MFSLVRLFHTLLQSVSVHSHFQQCKEDLVSPHPCQNLVLPPCLLVSVLIGMWWYLIIVSMCIALTGSDVNCLFVPLFALCTPSSVMSLQVLCQFFTELFGIFLQLTLRIL